LGDAVGYRPAAVGQKKPKPVWLMAVS